MDFVLLVNIYVQSTDIAPEDVNQCGKILYGHSNSVHRVSLLRNQKSKIPSQLRFAIAVLPEIRKRVVDAVLLAPVHVHPADLAFLHQKRPLRDVVPHRRLVQRVARGCSQLHLVQHVHQLRVVREVADEAVLVGVLAELEKGLVGLQLLDARHFAEGEGRAERALGRRQAVDEVDDGVADVGGDRVFRGELGPREAGAPVGFDGSHRASPLREGKRNQ